MKTQPTVINDWRPETKDLLNALTAEGFKLTSGNNGEDEFRFKGDLDAFIANLIACDESHLYITAPDGQKLWIYLVLGNEPGVMASDYSVHPLLDKVTEAHYAKWELKEQPKARGYYKDGKWVDMI